MFLCIIICGHANRKRRGVCNDMALALQWHQQSSIHYSSLHYFYGCNDLSYCVNCYDSWVNINFSVMLKLLRQPFCIWGTFQWSYSFKCVENEFLDARNIWFDIKMKSLCQLLREIWQFLEYDTTWWWPYWIFHFYEKCSRVAVCHPPGYHYWGPSHE